MQEEKERTNIILINLLTNLKFLKKMKMNEIYEAPMLEVLNVMIETGFAGSLDEDDPNMPVIPDPFA